MVQGRELHREDGPAFEDIDGTKEWFLYGKEYTEKDFNFCADILLGKIKELKKIEDNDSGQKIDVWIFDSAYESFLKYILIIMKY